MEGGTSSETISSILLQDAQPEKSSKYYRLNYLKTYMPIYVLEDSRRKKNYRLESFIKHAIRYVKININWIFRNIFF